MSVSNEVEKTAWWMLSKLKADSITFKSDAFLVDVTEQEDVCSAAQQRKLLESFQADGILSRRPFRGYLQDSLGILSVTDINKYWKADNFQVALSQPAFDEAYENYNQRYGEVVVRLTKDHTDLCIVIDDEKYPLHSFKAGSTPDILFDYLIFKQPNQELTKEVLTEESALPKNSQPLSTITYKAGFTGQLIKYFLPINERDKVKLRHQLILSASEAKKMTEQLRSLPSNSAKQ